MTKRSKMSALDAALKVLQDEGKPLHYQEITRRVLSAGLWQTNGKTPAATINAQLATNIKKNGPASAFRRAGRGIFTLNSDHTEPASASGNQGKQKRKQQPPSGKRSGARPLVLGYLERIASSAFSEFPQPITDLVHGKHGVYALYKGDRLYYVGLATNLRNRIKQHLNDKHAGKWNRFSLYLVRKAEHIRELETLILRIADPTGNSTRGVLPGAEDLWGQLHATIREEQERQIQAIFDVEKRARRRRHKTKQSRHPLPPSARTPSDRAPVLAQYISTPTRLRAFYKGQKLSAHVSRNGAIRFSGKLYTSPSLAGAVAVKRKTCNGWTFWKYERAPGDWVKLATLRK